MVAAALINDLAPDDFFRIEKRSKRDVAASEAMLLRHDKEYELNTSSSRPFFHTDNYLKINTTGLPAAEVAAMIAGSFRL